MSFVTAGVFQVMRRQVKYKPRKHWNDPLVTVGTTITWNQSFLRGVNEKDTFVLIFTKGDGYKDMYEWFVKQPEVNILYQSPPAINTRYSPTELRNFVVVFEWQKQVPVQNAEKTEKTQEETTLLNSPTEGLIVSPVVITDQLNMSEVFQQAEAPVGVW